MRLRAPPPRVQVETWKDDFRKRFEWTSVLGFTLGLLVGLGSLLQVCARAETGAQHVSERKAFP